MRKIRFNQKVTFAVIAAMGLGFGGYAVFNDLQQQRELESGVQRYLEEVGSATATSVEGWLSARTLLVEGTRQIIETSSSVEGIRQAISRPVMRDNFGMTYLGRADSTEFFNSPSKPMPASYDYRTRPRYQQAKAAGSLILSEPYLDTATQKLVVSMATPVLNEQKLLGVLGVDLELDSLVGIIAKQELGGRGEAFLVNSAGKVMVSRNSANNLKTLTDIYGQTVDLETRSVQELTINGQSKLLYFSPIANLPQQKWLVGLSLDKDMAYSSLNESRATAAIAILLIMVGVVSLLTLLMRSLMRPVAAMGAAMEDIADGDGDLTKRLIANTSDEFGDLARSFNRFVQRVHDSIQDVQHVTRELNQVSRQVMTNSQVTLQGADEQTERTLTVVAAIRELGAAAQEIASNASGASQGASSARKASHQGLELMDESTSSLMALSERIKVSMSNIETLNSKTNNIGTILDVIRSISEQTNLLALNAAIEAARAGDAGRGFAVVADEVRSLAHRTQNSTTEIHAMIAELQEDAREAVDVMSQSEAQCSVTAGTIERAGTSLQGMTQLVSDIDSIGLSVAAATEEQTAVVETLNVDLAHISELNDRCSEKLTLTMDACAELDRQASRLSTLVNGFKILKG